ncbi:MAG: hypothetical protein IIY84_03440 [Eubacterium sp.]|nr:hypothetical protein [Eubacterium sp.]
MTFDDLRYVAAAMTAAAVFLAMVLLIIFWRAGSHPGLRLSPGSGAGTAGKRRPLEAEETVLLPKTMKNEAQNDATDDERTG